MSAWGLGSLLARRSLLGSGACPSVLSPSLKARAFLVVRHNASLGGQRPGPRPLRLSVAAGGGFGAPVQQEKPSKRSKPTYSDMKKKAPADGAPVRKAKQKGGKGKNAPGGGGGEGLRVAKVMAAAGIASRRGAEELIFAGRVKVNGDVCETPATKVGPRDELIVDGKVVPTRGAAVTSKYYFVVNKPKGYICSNKETVEGKGRLAVDLLQPFIRKWRDGKPKDAIPPRLFSVGRLDVQSQGMLLITNDGEWANRVQHPSNGCTKEYVVKLDRAPSKKELATIAAGCMVDGAFVVPEFCDLAGRDPNSENRVRIVVSEGRNREVRQLVANAGREVITLKRTRIGGLPIPDNLGIGQYRELKAHEVRRVTDMGAQQNHVMSVARPGYVDLKAEAAKKAAHRRGRYGRGKGGNKSKSS